MALITSADLDHWGAYEGALFGDQAGLAEALIAAASDMIQRWCRRVFRKEEIVETHDGDGGAVLHLRRPPVWSITSVTVDGVALDAPAYVVPVLATDPDVLEVNFNARDLVRRDGAWPVGLRNVVATYTGGFAPIPAPIKQACCELVAHLLLGRSRDPAVGLEQAGEFSADRRPLEARLPASVRAKLGAYRLPLRGLTPASYEARRSGSW